ncbi:hypothetical protein L9F63_028074, partial [Diploptera punctata]
GVCLGHYLLLLIVRIAFTRDFVPFFSARNFIQPFIQLISFVPVIARQVYDSENVLTSSILFIKRQIIFFLATRFQNQTHFYSNYENRSNSRIFVSFTQ